MKKYIKHLICALVLITVFSFSLLEINKGINTKDTTYMPVTNKVIVLDAGHGGIDPGALNKEKTTNEKDINLQITLKLRELLEASGAVVVLTREEDESLYEDTGNKTTRQKYNENLKNRKKIIDQSKADLFISIHLNAFEQEKYYGAQTFYPSKDDTSKLLSKCIQEELKRVVDDTNEREVKPREDIYLLKENKITSVLIECGFLSNIKESELLKTDKHQEKISWAVYSGIQKYFTSQLHSSK